MKYFKNVVAFLTCITLLIACSEDPPDTGKVLISFKNSSTVDLDRFFVEAGIVFSETDSDLLIDLERNFLNEEEMIDFDPIVLNYGNYYLRYQYYLGNELLGDLRHKPFQIMIGEESIVDIER